MCATTLLAVLALTGRITLLLILRVPMQWSQQLTLNLHLTASLHAASPQPPNWGVECDSMTAHIMDQGWALGSLQAE